MLIPPERRDEEREILARIVRGEPIEHFETVRVAKDGRRIDISLTVSPDSQHLERGDRRLEDRAGHLSSQDPRGARPLPGQISTTRLRQLSDAEAITAHRSPRAGRTPRT